MKTAYGEIHAPREWWATVKKNFEKEGLYALQTEPCVWAVYEQDQGKNRQIGEVMAHVDDFILAGDEQNPKWNRLVVALEKLYVWGT